MNYLYWSLWDALVNWRPNFLLTLLIISLARLVGHAIRRLILYALPDVLAYGLV